MTRQRIPAVTAPQHYEDCPCCRGIGQVKTAESMAIEVMRTLMSKANTPMFGGFRSKSIPRG